VVPGPFLHLLGEIDVLEKAIKLAVKKRLKQIGCYSHWPVQFGMGEQTLDCIACINGRYVAIETKRPGAKPTKLQLITMKKISDAGGLVYVVDNLEAVDRMLEELKKL
jgi:hypothetical protein